MKKNLLIIALLVLGFGSIVYSAPIYNYQPTLLPIADNSYDLGTSTKVWRNIYTNQICLSTDCKTAWPTGGGGSGGGSWSTTTSQVPNRLINYPNNNTDIVNIGSTSTTTGKFYLDPNISLASFLGNFNFQFASGTSITISGSSYIPKLGNLTSNGFVKTSGGDGTLGVDTNTYLTGSGAGITAVSVSSANGFAGSSSGGATPALTLTTSISGLLKGNGTAISAGSNGTDYTLITAKTCSAGQHVNDVTAAGVFTCTADSGGSGGGTGNVATSTGETAGQLGVWTSTNGTPATLGKVATTTLSLSGFPANIPNTLGSLVGGSNTTWTWWGLATTSQPASSNILTSNGSAGVYGTATSTLTPSSPLTGSFVQVGSGGSVGCTTAASGVAGCLSNTSFDTFNNKQATISVTTPITLTGASVGIVNQGTTAQVLHGNASGNASFGAIVNADITNSTIDLTTKVTGALPVANGGTNATSFALNSIITSNSGGTALIATGTQLTVGNILATTTANNTFAGNILAPLGLVGTPSYSFSADTNTGIYNQGVDQLDFTTGGIRRGGFSADGAFGIGSSTPTMALGSMQISTTSGAGFKPQLILSDQSASANQKHINLVSQGGTFSIGSSNDVYATSTTQAFAINLKAGVSPGMQIATGTQEAAITTAIINLGANGVSTNASTTIHMAKMQWEGMSSAGVYQCAYFVGSALIVQAGFCNN